MRLVPKIASEAAALTVTDARKAAKYSASVENFLSFVSNRVWQEKARFHVSVKLSIFRKSRSLQSCKYLCKGECMNEIEYFL